MAVSLTLSVLSETLAVCRLSSGSNVPRWASARGFWSVTHTGDEVSIVCCEKQVPAEVAADRGWRCLKVAGPLDLSLTGILASLASPLAAAQVSVFVISTYETDYLLVKTPTLRKALDVLAGAGHQIVGG